MHSCTFIGHSACYKNIEQKLYNSIETLIKNSNVYTFYVGTHGQYDALVYRVLCELEKIYKINIFVVLAYLNQNKENIYYDITKTIFPEVLEKTPFRFAINKRNQYMIDRSQYLICYVNNTFSNSHKFVKTAIKKNLNIINLGSCDLADIR